MKNILFDLTKGCSWGDKSQLIPEIAWYSKNKYVPLILTDNWNNKRFNSATFSPTDSDSGGDYYYDEKTEPVDYFLNLISPSLKADFFDIASGSGNVDRDSFMAAAKSASYVPYASARQILPWRNKNASQFQYKIKKIFNKDNFSKIESTLQKTKNIVIYFDWLNDSPDGSIPRRNGKTLPWGHRKRLFNHIKEYVKQIDYFCLQNPRFRIVVVNKLAGGIKNFLKSNFLDLTNFEKDGIVFSEMLFLICKYCDISLGNANQSFSTWITLQENMEHVVFTSPAHKNDNYKLFNYKYSQVDPPSAEHLLTTWPNKKELKKPNEDLKEQFENHERWPWMSDLGNQYNPPTSHGTFQTTVMKINK